MGQLFRYRPHTELHSAVTVSTRQFLDSLVFPLLGRGERWVRTLDGAEVDTLFPFGDFEDLLINWPISYMLNQNKYTAPVIQRMSQTDEGADKFQTPL